MRSLLGWSIPDAVIFVQELMVAAVVLPLGYVAAHGGHVAVEVLTASMPERIQPWLNLLASTVGFVALLPVVYGGYLDLATALREGAYFFGDLELPKWPGRAAFFVGYGFFVLRLAIQIVHDLRSLPGGPARTPEPGPDSR